MMIRELNKSEEIPYNLLLLADETVAGIDQYIHNCVIYVFEEHKEMIGVCAVETLNDETIEIQNIAVLEQHQRRGIGTQLLKDVFKRAKRAGFKTVLIGTGDIATGQIALYQRVGFEIFEIKKDFFVKKYPEPIYENGVQLRDMVVLRREL